MIYTQKIEKYLTFENADQVSAANHEFTKDGALNVRCESGEFVSIAFTVAHIAAIEALLNILYDHRGDFDEAKQQADEVAAA